MTLILSMSVTGHTANAQLDYCCWNKPLILSLISTGALAAAMLAKKLEKHTKSSFAQTTNPPVRGDQPKEMEMKLNLEHVKSNLYYSAVTKRHYLLINSRYRKAELTA